MPFLLSEMAKLEKDPLRKGIIQNLRKHSVVSDLLPWETTAALNTLAVRWKTLPSVAFRRLNAAYSEGVGKVEHVTYSIYPLGHDIDVDKVYSRAKDVIVDPLKLNIQMTLQAMAFEINDRTINGDQASDPVGFEGLKKLISNLPSSQLITAATNGLNIGPAGITDALALTFLDKLDEAIFAVRGGAALAFMNDSCFLRFNAALRRLKLLAQTRDQFDRVVTEYQGVQFYNIGYKSDKTTRIMPNTETMGTSSISTSIYFLRPGVGDGVHMIQEYAMESYPVGELEAKPVSRYRIDWPIGLALWDDYAVSRLQGVQAVD